MNKSIKLIAVFGSLLLTQAVSAQETTKSPYSRFGIGEIQKNYSVYNKGMGGITNGVRNEYSINYGNPASYSAIALTTFEMGAYAGFTQIRNNSTSQQYSNAALNYFAIAFPVAKKMGGSFGLIPFSGVGYRSTLKSSITGVGPVNNIFEGDGGLNQFYLGTSYKLFPNLSLGVNVSYLFGSISDIRANEFNDTLSYLNIRQNNSTYVGDIYSNFGLQYKKQINGRFLTLAYSGALEHKMTASRNRLSERYIYSSAGYETVVDTVENTNNIDGKVILPAYHSFGFSISKENNWLVGADLSVGQWSNYRNFGVDEGLKNTLEVAVGASFTPQYNAVGNYFKIVEYRLGANYTKSYISINNHDINQIGVTAGLGFPLPKSASKINLALEAGKRGTTSANLVQENYLNVFLGFTFCDKWFIKRRYD